MGATDASSYAQKPAFHALFLTCALVPIPVGRGAGYMSELTRLLAAKPRGGPLRRAVSEQALQKPTGCPGRARPGAPSASPSRTLAAEKAWAGGVVLDPEARAPDEPGLPYGTGHSLL